jgi:multidrug resistance efflux pump
MERKGTRGDAAKSTSEAVRARRRAAFLATIRGASQADEPSGAEPRSTRPEPLPMKESAVVPPTRPEPLPPTRSRMRVEALAQASGGKTSAVGHLAEPNSPRASEQIVETKKPAPAGTGGDKGRGLFRVEALRHRLTSEEGRGVVRVSPPWTWALLVVALCGVVTALVVSFVGKVEVTGRARGVLRPTAGIRVLTSQATGTVVEVLARSGDAVKAGATILRIESAAVQAQLLEADRDLAAVRTRFSSATAEVDHHYAEQVESLRSRSKRLDEEIVSLRSSVSLQERHVKADEELLRKGLVSELSVADTKETLAQAERQLSGAETVLDQTRQELASLEARRQDEVWQRQQVVSAAQNKRDALALMMRENVVEAPDAGMVEGLLVKVGEVVKAGQAVGEIVPVNSTLRAVCFLPERDRAFAKPGDEVQLELDQLPHAEYGALKAHVTRISDDLASPSEVAEAFGEGQKLTEPSYKVELAITDTSAADAAGVKLRTGSLLDARFTLRRLRLITLALSPLKRWLH